MLEDGGPTLLGHQAFFLEIGAWSTRLERRHHGCRHKTLAKQHPEAYSVNILRKNPSKNHANSAATGVNRKHVKRFVGESFPRHFFQEKDSHSSDHAKHGRAPYGDLISNNVSYRALRRRGNEGGDAQNPPQG